MRELAARAIEPHAGDDDVVARLAGVIVDRRRATMIGVGLVALFLLFVMVDARHYGHLSTGDTDNLVSGTRTALDCVRSGDFVGCGQIEGTVQTEVFPYPLLQYVPAAALVELGRADGQILGDLRWLNLAALAGVLGVSWWAFRARPRLACLMWVVVLSSSMLYQANAAFGEALAAFVVVCAVVAATTRRPLLIAVACAAAILGKETLAPFVVVLCLLCAREPDATAVLPRRRVTIAVAVGACAGLVASALFNVFRFGGPRNALYLDDSTRTQGLGRKVEWFAALWVSPAGGIAWFWPALVVVTVAGVVAALRSPVRRDRLFALAPAGVLCAQLAGLALWFAPFGWVAFGPRLAVPMLPAIAFAMLWVNGDAIVRLLGATGRRALVVALGLPMIAIPMYGAPWRAWGSILELIAADDVCPAMGDFADTADYYRCTSHAMWRLHPQILDDTFAVAASLAGTTWVLAPAACVCLLVAALVPGRESHEVTAA